jgi:hypothetical protein
MAVDPGSIDHLSQVISQVIGPSFLLGAVASFIAILLSRMNNVIERVRMLNALPEGDSLKADIPRLQRRVRLVNRAVILAIAAGVVAALLILATFLAALFHLQHVWVAAVLFMISLALLCAALVVFAREINIGLSENDHY